MPLFALRLNFMVNTCLDLRFLVVRGAAGDLGEVGGLEDSPSSLAGTAPLATASASLSLRTLSVL